MHQSFLILLPLVVLLIPVTANESTVVVTGGENDVATRPQDTNLVPSLHWFKLWNSWRRSLSSSMKTFSNFLPRSSTISSNRVLPGTTLHDNDNENENNNIIMRESEKLMMNHRKLEHRHRFLQNHQGHRMGRTSAPTPTPTPTSSHDDEQQQEEDKDFVYVDCQDYDVDCDLYSFAGMKFHIFQSHHAEEEEKNHLPLTMDAAYQLLEPMHLELGIPPKHYRDYAYMPVYGYHPSIGENAPTLHDTEPESCVARLDDPHTQDDFTTHKGELDPKTNMDEQNAWWQWWFSSGNPWWRNNRQSDYTTERTAFAGGSHGQVWKGRRVCSHVFSSTSSSSSSSSFDPERGDCDEEKPLILKKLKVEQGYRLLEAGLREIYFGQWIRGQDESFLFTTYVDHFFRELPNRLTGTKDLELWIVFEDAGPSLRNYIYAPIMTPSGFVMFQHSPLWAQLRMSSRNDAAKPDWQDDSPQIRKDTGNKFPKGHGKLSNGGRQVLRSVLQQILSAAAVLHEHGIVHRDIKPSNVMCNSDVPLEDLFVMEKLPLIHCRLGDFSSGWDQYTDENLYTKGPSPLEQTNEYAPPESYLGPQWVPFDSRRPQSYDSWSVGVLALELLLGTPNVFTVDQRTTALLTTKMKKKGASDEELQRALYLAALSQFCIYVPTSTEQQKSWPHRYGDPLHNTAMTKESCTLQDFHRALRARDPLGIGFDSSTDLLLHLVWQLLAWDPMERITAAEALQHPYFLSPDGTGDFSDLIPGRHNALESQMLDPVLDFSVEETVHEFTCPKCGRTFSDWRSCNQHARMRKHAKFCTYDRTHLPTCINTHSMLPAHPTSGYCDLQGRRRTIEDFHSIHLYKTVQYYAIFDGHTGNVASKYAASTLYNNMVRHLPNLPHVAEQKDWKANIERNVSLAFQDTHEGFIDALTRVPTMDQSGTTATALLVTDDVVIVASLGDSRAVLSSFDSEGNIFPVQLTNDHVAADPKERDMVLDRGGSVSVVAGGLARVNGTLAITRSIGDAALAPVLSRQPDVSSMTRHEILSLCGQKRHDVPCFVVLASDGLWDVMSNHEAVEMVAEVVASYDSTDRVSWNNGGAFQEAAELLAVDAFVRGSSDNIGVCVVAITS